MHVESTLIHTASSSEDTENFKNLALYIHWPYCVHKCPYCDFNSHVRDKRPDAAYLKALTSELTDFIHWYPELNRMYRVSSIFFGGGTPSLMQPDHVDQILTTIREHYKLDEACEITLEANPSSVDSGKFHAFHQAGINRLSLGIQALDDQLLRFLDRPHNAVEAVEAITLAKNEFDRISFDLIYGMTGQSRQAWQTQLNEALNFTPTHLSLYMLTIEAGTHFMTRTRRGECLTLAGDESAILYQDTVNCMRQAGLERYEISNFAKAGHECRHNLSYWRYQDYVGFGPGAHGRIKHENQRYALSRTRLPEHWMKEILEKDGNATLLPTKLSDKDSWMEAAIMGMRLNEPFKEQDLNKLCGIGFEAFDSNGLAKMIEAGWLELKGESPNRMLLINDHGKLRLDGILEQIL